MEPLHVEREAALVHRNDDAIDDGPAAQVVPRHLPPDPLDREDVVSWLANLFMLRREHQPLIAREEDLPGIGRVRVTYVVDCMGAMCPRPQLLTMKILSQVEPGEVIEVVSDNPAAVEASAREAGLRVDGVRTRRDHHWFTRREAGAALERARRAGGWVLLTAKDEVRWPGGAPRERVAVLEVDWEGVCGGEAVERVALGAQGG